MRARSDSKLTSQLEKQVSVLKEEIQRQHTELMQTREALKGERLRVYDLELALQEKDKTLEQQQIDYDRDLRELISKLLVLESDFRKEQKEIIEVLQDANAKLEWQAKQLEAKDRSIESKRKEIDAIKDANKTLLDSLSQIRHLSPNATNNNNLSIGNNPVSTSDTHFGRRSSSSSLKSPTSRGPKSPRSPRSPRRSKKSSDDTKLRRTASPWREELTSFF